jgi:hypothetical protein
MASHGAENKVLETVTVGLFHWAIFCFNVVSAELTRQVAPDIPTAAKSGTMIFKISQLSICTSVAAPAPPLNLQCVESTLT